MEIMFQGITVIGSGKFLLKMLLDGVGNSCTVPLVFIEQWLNSRLEGTALLKKLSACPVSIGSLLH